MINEFELIMENAPKITKMKSLGSEEFVAFSSKKGIEVRLASSEKHLEFLPHIEFLYSFFQNNKIFWIIPCASPRGRIYGYVLRSFMGKEYRSVANNGAPQLLFGWEDFDDKFRYGVPIVLREGIKDALFVKTIYPYALAFLSSDVSEDTLNYLCLITDKFVLALDSDSSGEKHRKKLKDSLHRRKCQATDMFPKEKDFGQYFVNRNFYDRYFKQQFFLAVQKLGV